MGSDSSKPHTDPTTIETINYRHSAGSDQGSGGCRDGPALTGALFRHPSHLCYLPKRHALIISDQMNHMIRYYDLTSDMVSTVAGSNGGTTSMVDSGGRAGIEGFVDDCSGDRALFSNPAGLCYHPSNENVVF